MSSLSDPENRLPAPEPAPSSLGAKISWMITAAATLAAVLLAFRINTSNTEAKLLREDAELARMEVRSINQQLEAEHILAARQFADLRAKTVTVPVIFVALAAAQPANGRPAAVIAWQPANQAGAFFSDELPPPAPDEDYRLWIETTAGGTIAAGSIAVSSAHPTKVEFAVAVPVKTASRFILTREQKTGVTQPTGPVVLSGAP